ncbi:MAG TPA: crotonase/enoyl-CoA hydratase family protein [Acidimicrobiales bacterium]|nr:crotonase/enoyl-CoA hydratase family protein [Acidimicrobiales bacterium]
MPERPHGPQVPPIAANVAQRPHRVFDVERDAGVATVWLDRPDARNALGGAFFEELPRVMGEVSDDPAVRAVVVCARGRDFSVGLDLEEMSGIFTGEPVGTATTPDDLAPGPAPLAASAAARAAATRRSVLGLQAAVNAVAACPKPVIAAVHGYCIGGGMDLVTACDIRLASVDAVFSVRETRMAIVADLGTLQRLPRIVGAGHVAELALTGKDVDARRARDIGLVNDVYPDRDALFEAAAAMGREIAALSPLAVQGTKSVLAANDGRTVAQGLDYVATWNAGMLASKDLAEAFSAFVEKRPPRFTGT